MCFLYNFYTSIYNTGHIDYIFQMDSTPISSYKSKPDDFTSMLADAVTNVQYKLFILMFLTFIGLSTDVFINRVLTKFSGAVEGKTPTSWGTGLQAIFLVIACLVFDLLIQMEVV